MIERFGGIFFTNNDNLANPGSLEYVLEAIQGSLFGHDLFPTILEKAAAIGFRTIEGHVFHDGNKRTGMEACRLFLELNGYEMRIDREVIEFAIKAASNQIVFEEFVQWLASRIKPL
jgi:death-on-curing protein